MSSMLYMLFGEIMYCIIIINIEPTSSTSPITQKTAIQTTKMPFTTTIQTTKTPFTTGTQPTEKPFTTTIQTTEKPFTGKFICI